MEYAGGKCLLCSEKVLPALDFHHINPQDKLKNISEFYCWSEELVEELDKCACLCSNCHRKVTAGLVDHEIFVDLEY